MDDIDVKRRIEDELDWEPSVDAAHIGVSVENGVVTLTGHVPTYAEKLSAERAVRRVKGVRAVAQDLEVRLPTSLRIDDQDIARRAANSLMWNTNAPDDRILITVQRGAITLRGEVDWQYQRSAAENAVRSLSGVVAVYNQISLRRRPQPADIKRRIESALARNASSEANAVRVEVADGKVTLEGTVHSWFDRKVIEDSVWAAPGVRQVDDHLEVT
jgi:osmotically-inducible protein OsmY